MLKDMPMMEQPREKLIQKGVTHLTNSDLLAIILKTGNPNQSAVELGQSIINSCNDDLTELNQYTIEELTAFNGIGETKACQILASLELGKRVMQATGLKRHKIACPDDVISYFSAELSDAKVEKFIIILLNTKNEIINWEIISIGSLNASIVHPREVFNRAIKRSAASILVVHNHPSGHVAPSNEDINITKRLFEAGQLIGIPLIDHIIIGKGHYYSFKEQNQL